MVTNEVLETRYRTLDENGFLICESDSLEEALVISRGMAFTLETMTKRVVVSRWRQVDANEVANLIAMYG